MPLHGVSKNIMSARQKETGYGTSQNPERFQQQDYLQLKKLLMTQNKLFRDEAFPPDQRSIGQDKLVPEKLAQVQWLRPRDLVTTPFFILDGASRFDFGQGDLGNCWFLASLGALTFHEEIFKLVVPQDQTCLGKDYCGLFHFRFWRFGKWVDVVIDDKLPTIERKPIFARSKDEREFWPALLEKAYAKYVKTSTLFLRHRIGELFDARDNLLPEYCRVCGSYADMTSGTPAEAMRDFTGGVHMCIQLSDPCPNLWNLLCRAGRSKTFMSCSSIPKKEATPGDMLPNGLVPGHAYTLTGLKQLQSQETMVNLVRLWNPWGHGEWIGDWSDKSPLWRDVSTKDREKCLTVQNDGEFW
ncbi:hypothetical protein CCH79_00004323 [Gambusia affinis]|uniref:Calpain catalytic domain-containing protein n=1 Tax=Gambusia affinis TaxID=33528 RepID=A0A315UYI2_GAMAF|nr:hypothetical protein CCH79_00004323 [Gambusia affinis]